MSKNLRCAVALWVAACTTFPSAGHAQETTTAPQPSSPLFRSAGPVIPLKVQIVISRYQGEKKISSLPYTLAVNANDGRIDPAGNYVPEGGPARLRSGGRIPVAMIPPAAVAQGKDPLAFGFNYQNVGTNIDCLARTTDDGRFRVSVSIEDTSVDINNQPTPAKPDVPVDPLSRVPRFRTFQSSNTLILKDGQSSEFTVASDKTTGDVTKVDVTVSVVK